jgi:hypothetical protein
VGRSATARRGFGQGSARTERGGMQALLDRILTGGELDNDEDDTEEDEPDE